VSKGRFRLRTISPFSYVEPVAANADASLADKNPGIIYKIDPTSRISDEGELTLPTNDSRFSSVSLAKS